MPYVGTTSGTGDRSIAETDREAANGVATSAFEDAIIGA
jgi:hypothetical protein